jgi:hypothetical protein
VYGLGEFQASVEIPKNFQLYLRKEKIWVEVKRSIQKVNNVFLVGLREEAGYLKSIEIIGYGPWRDEEIKHIEAAVEEIIKKYISK